MSYAEYIICVYEHNVSLLYMYMCYDKQMYVFFHIRIIQKIRTTD